MQIVKCKNCGAQLDITKAVGGVVECEYCHSKHTLAKSNDTNAVNFLAMGEHGLDNGKFDEAYSAFSKAANLDGNEPEAYFGMALAGNKVRYIKDVKNNCLQPICYDATNISFANDAHYKKALALAFAEQKGEYERRAKEIDYIRNEFYKLKQSGKEYDCFICVKVSGDGGHKTIDSERANDIYYHLKDKGYRPFYSEREIQNETGADYEARILYALFSSPCMLVVCSDENYLQTPWVKNEYMRFISLINDEQKEANSIAIGFFDTPIEHLPGRNGRLQGVCLKNPDAYSKIVDFVDSCAPSAKIRKLQAEEKRKAEEAELKRQLKEQAELQAKQLEEFKRSQEKAQRELQERLAALQSSADTPTNTVSVGGETNVQALLIRVNQFLDGGDFESAKKYCNKILDIAPNNGEAWLSLFMAGFGASNPSVLLRKVSESRFASSNQILQKKSEMSFTNAKKYAVNHKDLLDEIEAVLDKKYNEKLNCEQEEERQRKEAEEKQRIKEIIRRNCTINGHCLEKFSKECTLDEVAIPDSVTSIGNWAFYDCDSITSITIPDSVTNIGDKAFFGCSSLTSITIPDSVTSIGDMAFSCCSSLTSITIPSSVTSIGWGAFNSCSNLTSITVAEGNTKYHSAGNCLIETATKTLIAGCMNSVIPTDGSVWSIGSSAFDGCRNLTSITIPSSVWSIGDFAFSCCSSLTSITMPSNMRSIGTKAFCDCSSLTSITIPIGVTSIGEDAFRDCSALTSITIPSSVTSIEDKAFSGCRKLTNITFGGKKRQWRAMEKKSSWNGLEGKTVTCKNGVLIIR